MRPYILHLLTKTLLVGSFLLCTSCTAVEAVSRTTKNVLGIPEPRQAEPMQFGGVRNEYHAALERRKQDAIMEILGERSGQ